MTVSERLRDWDRPEALSPCPRKISLLRGFSHSERGKSMNQLSSWVSFVYFQGLKGLTTKAPSTTLRAG